MLYDEWFAQVLEGTETEVRGLYEKIASDPRHDSLELREAEPVGARAFGRWAMALVAAEISAISSGLIEMGGNTQAESPECTPAASICSMIPPMMVA